MEDKCHGQTGATKTALCASDAAEPPNFFSNNFLRLIYVRTKENFQKI
jgi:hypothetical protein